MYVLYIVDCEYELTEAPLLAELIQEFKQWTRGQSMQLAVLILHKKKIELFRDEIKEHLESKQIELESFGLTCLIEGL